MTEPVATPEPALTGGGRGQWIGLAIGLPVMAYGVRGVLIDADKTHPAELARWVLGAAIVHDLVFVPLVLVVSWVLRRWAPGWLRPPLQWATATTMVLAIYAWPFVRGYGVNPTVPSLLARDYSTGLTAYGAVVCSAAAAWAVVRRRKGGTAGPMIDMTDGPGHGVDTSASRQGGDPG